MAHGTIKRRRGKRGLKPSRRQAAPASNPAVIIAGPTASGKSACALAVAREFRGTVINADAMQLYTELSVLTNRPGRDELRGAPHRLFGALSVRDPSSAGRWRSLALAEMAAAAEQQRLPVLAGGTGLYLKALLSGLATVPPIPPRIHDEARLLYEVVGREGLLAELAIRDPAMGAPPRDKQRLLRAFEVLVATGRPLRDWQSRTRRGVSAGYRYAVILFDPPRDTLYAAIDRRFDRMMENGALKEALAIEALGLDPGLPALKSVGLRELLAHLRGELGLEEAVARAKQASRNYAKRQVTWFRHQLPAGLKLNAQFSESLRDEIFSFIRRFLLTPRA
jgi:tRNA dimethylallyltransferase